MNGAENIPLFLIFVVIVECFLLFAFFFDFRFDLLQSRNLPNDIGSKERKNGIEKTSDCFRLSVDYTPIFRRICPCKFFADFCVMEIIILSFCKVSAFRTYSSVSSIAFVSRFERSALFAVKAITCSCNFPRFRGIFPLFASVKASTYT